MTTYWGLYSILSKRWATSEVHSNYDSPIGTIVFYPLKSIAEAHLDILRRCWPKDECPWEVRKFPFSEFDS